MESVECCWGGRTVQTVLCDATLLFFLEVQKSMTNEVNQKKEEEVEELKIKKWKKMT